MRMKYFVIVIACALSLGVIAYGQTQLRTVSLVEVIARPEKFDGELVALQGFMRFDREPKHGVSVSLYLHQEDADNLIASNMVLVIPSEQMLRDEEKLDRMYVRITGVFHSIPVSNKDSSHGGVIKDIQSCAMWSDPNRPIGLKGGNRRYK